MNWSLAHVGWWVSLGAVGSAAGRAMPAMLTIWKGISPSSFSVMGESWVDCNAGSQAQWPGSRHFSYNGKYWDGQGRLPMSPGVIRTRAVQESLGVQACLPQARTGARFAICNLDTQAEAEEAAWPTPPARTEPCHVTKSFTFQNRRGADFSRSFHTGHTRRPLPATQMPASPRQGLREGVK